TQAATVPVPAEFTRPALELIAVAIEVANHARFATPPTITLQTRDNRPEPITTKLTVDGAVVTAPVSNLVDGGHSLTAIVTDFAGNVSRVDRTFAIGAGASGGACAITSLDPTNN